MPSYGAAKSRDKPSKYSTAGGVERVGGKKVNGGAAKAVSKNQDAVADYLYRAESAESVSDLVSLRKGSFLIARVSQNTGSGVKVLLETQAAADTPVFVPFAKSIRFHGHAATKTDRANCMCAHDLVLVSGGFAAAKFSPVARLRLKKVFDRFTVSVPKGFFAAAPSLNGEYEEDDEDCVGGFQFDRSDEAEMEAAAEEERKAEEARRVRLRTGGGGNGRVRSSDAVRKTLREELEALQAVSKKRVAEDEAPPPPQEESEAEEDIAAASGSKGPNRAERRAAASRAAEEAAEEAARLARIAELQSWLADEAEAEERAERGWEELKANGAGDWEAFVDGI